MVADAATGEYSDILPGYEGHVRSIAWQDADTIVFVGDEGTATKLKKIARTGGEAMNLPTHGDAIWSSVSLSKDG